jgi:hypothetical protein
MFTVLAPSVILELEISSPPPVHAVDIGPRLEAVIATGSTICRIPLGIDICPSLKDDRMPPAVRRVDA